MAATYEFVRSDKTMVQRSSDNAFVPWNAEGNHPFDERGYSYEIWVGDGSPVPLPFDPQKWPEG
jgi:hypothetical protein